MEIRTDDGPVPGTSRRKARALLAFLALKPTRSSPREELAALLWGDQPEERARASLRQTLFLLRRFLAPYHSELLRATGESIALAEDAVQTDVEIFERLSGSDSIPALADAAALYAGSFLEDLHLQEEPFVDWQSHERSRLEQMAADTLERLASLQLDSGDVQDASTNARRLLSLDPARESGHRLLMSALARAGMRSAALEQYGRCQCILTETLGVEPEPSTQRMFEAIRSHPEFRAQDERSTGRESSFSESALIEEPVAKSRSARRQLTVMRCGLAGAAALSQSMDPEDYVDILNAYRRTVSKAIGRYDGHVAGSAGDDLVVYFGYPHAHEDDAERAVRAGIGVVDSLRSLEPQHGRELKVHIGIASGLVITDGVSDERLAENSVAGAAPHVAARLRDGVPPNAVALAESTAKLVRGRVDLKETSPPTAQDDDESTSAYQALAIRDVSRFEATTMAGGLSPLTGRQSEISLLVERWKQATQGLGQVVLLAGEPGIGKSRIAEEMRRRIDSEPSIVLRYQCSPYHTGSAFYPFVEHLQRAAGFTRDDDANAKLAKLESLIRRTLPCADTAMPLVASLLSLPFDRYPPLNLSPEKQKAETIRVLATMLEALAGAKPVLLVFEDAQWSDPSSRELLETALDRIQSLRVLAVITFRPEFTPPWTGYGHVTAHWLNRLNRREVTAMVERILEGKTLPPEVLEQIVSRTDGVPLFVEELTRSIMDAGVLAKDEDGYHATDPVPASEIPLTLREALLSRLDRLASARDVAQIGACIGREFSYEILAAVIPRPDDDLEKALSQLVDNGLLFGRGEPPEATYKFKHALIQDTARESLLRKRRQELHRRIAGVLEAQYPDLTADRPELLAQHYASAGLTDQALDYYIRAGNLAIARSAYTEALLLLNAGWEIVHSQSERARTDRDGLRLHAARAQAFLATRGYLASETFAAYRQAYRHCEALNFPADSVPVLRGIFNAYNAQGRFQAAREVAQRCLQLVREQEDPASLSLAQRLMGQNLFLMGELRAASRHLQDALTLSDEAEGSSSWTPSLKSSPLKYMPMTCWLLGYPDKSLRYLEDSLDYARRADSVFDLALALMWAYNTRILRREYACALDNAIELYALARAHELPDFVGVAGSQRSLAEYYVDSCPVGTADAAAASVSAYRDKMGKWNAPFYLGMQSEILLRTGPIKDALSVVEDALELAGQTGERWNEPDLRRIRGEALIAQSGADDEAETCLLESLAVARDQSAKSLELRSAIGLACLLRDRGEHRHARDILAPRYDCFSEGFDSPDLTSARSLLEELS